MDQLVSRVPCNAVRLCCLRRTSDIHLCLVQGSLGTAAFQYFRCDDFRFGSDRSPGKRYNPSMAGPVSAGSGRPLLVFADACLCSHAGLDAPRAESALVENSRITAIVLMLIGIFLDWSQPFFVDFNFREHTQYLKRSPVGAIVQIPINPPGWYMYLIKR